MSDRHGDIKIAIEGKNAKKMYDIITNAHSYKQYPNSLKLDYRKDLLLIEESWWGYSVFSDFVLPFIMGDDYYYLSYMGHKGSWETNDHMGKYFKLPPEPKTCSNCGTPLIFGAKFCHECGTKVEAAD